MLSAKTFNIKEASYVTADKVQLAEEDKISFLMKKLNKMFRKKGGHKGREMNHSKAKKNCKEKKQVMCYDCKKPKHFRSESISKAKTF